MPSWTKCESSLTATKTYKEKYIKLLPKENDVYMRLAWETEKTYALEHLRTPDNINLLVLSTRHIYSSAVTTRLNLKSYCDINTKNINLPDHQRVLIQDARHIIVMDNDLTNLNIEWIKSLHKNKLFLVIHNTYQSQKGKTFHLASNKETVLAELWGWARQMSILPFEK
ncbi:DNA replication origin-binding helicase [Gigaspora margarita]|uniref:DNA replication origin-binding helicase n=1 Tax=Gigaspora margarita TaxID=4874 RepID=A0A8H4A3L6_GIGMA|nr:DNA replication origin-binding helicase [Gigaspora margarita]